MGLDDLADREGWQVEGDAARVHYRGDGARYSVEYYAGPGRVLYWRPPADDGAAVPVDREAVPAGLRARIREDLAAAGLDPEAETRPL